MQLPIATATLSVGAILVGAISVGAMVAPQASYGSQQRACIARVLHSEELPFAPFHHWLVRVTLEVTAPNGRAYEMDLHDNMPWQARPPRRGQAFRLSCDPVNPADLHLIR
jgi:hypothetical protein